MPSLEKLDHTLAVAHDELKDMLEEVEKAIDTKDPAIKSRLIKRLQERLYHAAKQMPFPVLQHH